MNGTGCGLSLAIYHSSGYRWNESVLKGFAFSALPIHFYSSVISFIVFAKSTSYSSFSF